MGDEESISRKPSDTLDPEVEKEETNSACWPNTMRIFLYTCYLEKLEKYLSQRYRDSLRVDFEVAESFRRNNGISVDSYY